jgi:hypothetical protein
MQLVGGPVLGLFFIRPTTTPSNTDRAGNLSVQSAAVGPGRVFHSMSSSQGAEKKGQERRVRAALFQFFSWNSLTSLMRYLISSVRLFVIFFIFPLLMALVAICFIVFSWLQLFYYLFLFFSTFRETFVFVLFSVHSRADV